MGGWAPKNRSLCELKIDYYVNCLPEAMHRLRFQGYSKLPSGARPITRNADGGLRLGMNCRRASWSCAFLSISCKVKQKGKRNSDRLLHHAECDGNRRQVLVYSQDFCSHKPTLLPGLPSKSKNTLKTLSRTGFWWLVVNWPFHAAPIMWRMILLSCCYIKVDNETFHDWASIYHGNHPL